MTSPRAIAHVDADAFFASVEQAVHPEYRGKPVVTGLERNIVSAASYEAKALGIKRGVALWDVKKICPECIVLPSDYETYSLFSLRIFEILRRYTPDVEEYSIDEGFIDLTGVARLHRKSYQRIVEEIQSSVKKELGIGVSIGLSMNKTLAKLASGLRKPMGILSVWFDDLPDFLAKLPVEKICGIGPSSKALLNKLGITTSLQFANLPVEAARRYMGKLGAELCLELKGEIVNSVDASIRPAQKSIMKSKTFTPPSKDREFVFAQMVRNMESACIKASRHDLGAKSIIIYLRKNDFSHVSACGDFPILAHRPHEILPLLKELFAEIFDPKSIYRATGVILEGLRTVTDRQYSLFEDTELSKKGDSLYSEITGINSRYGKHTVSSGTSLYLKKAPPVSRTKKAARKENLLPGESARRRLGLPLWEIKV